MLLERRAAVNDAAEVCKLLLDCRAEVDKCTCGMLLDNRAGVDKCTFFFGTNPLTVSSTLGYTAICKMLLDNCAEVDELRK